MTHRTLDYIFYSALCIHKSPKPFVDIKFALIEGFSLFSWYEFRILHRRFQRGSTCIIDTKIPDISAKEPHFSDFNFIFCSAVSEGAQRRSAKERAAVCAFKTPNACVNSQRIAVSCCRAIHSVLVSGIPVPWLEPRTGTRQAGGL